MAKHPDIMSFITMRIPSFLNRDRHTAIVGRVFSKPDSGKAPKAKFVDNNILVFVQPISNVNRVESTNTVVVNIFDVRKLLVFSELHGGRHISGEVSGPVLKL